MPLSACSRNGNKTRDLASPTPTLFAATPTVPGIARPAQTSTIGPGTATPRTRAEAFLRRIAPTDADLPPGSTPEPSTVQEGPHSQTDARTLYIYQTGFDWPGGPPVPPGGVIFGVRYTGFAFADADRAPANFGQLAESTRAAAVGGLLNRVQDPRAERVDDVSLGDETFAWRASGPGAGTPGSDAVRWAITVRRGAAAFTLVVDGAGAAPDALARDLARRLDQRLAAALAAGAWP